MKRTVSPRATTPGARARSLSSAQLERVTAGLAHPQPQFDAVQPQIVGYPDPQGRVVTRPVR
jgi:hypothetical protein